MEDAQIVALYFRRDEAAITETDRKYGPFCRRMAENILTLREDAEECVNDAYLRAWNAMPPRRPGLLSTFLGKLTRNVAINRYWRNTAQKRGGGVAALVLGEIEELVSGSDSVEGEMDRKELVRAINDFLGRLPEEKRSIFVCRYWYFDRVSVTLNRLRAKLRGELLERGFEL